MISPNLLNEIEQLSLDERLALLEFLSRNIRLSVKDVEIGRARGLLATDQSAPSDMDVESAYIDYLDEKYR